MTHLDTNVIIHYLKGHEKVVARFQSASAREVDISAVVAYEIAYGTLKIDSSRRRAALSDLLAELGRVPFDQEAALEAARIRVDLENRRFSIGPMDLLVAATAVSRGAVLVTNNTREFSRVRGLRLIDWTK